MATIKQKLAVKKILENNGNVSKSMKDAGYARGTAKNPQQLTRSKGWLELMEKELPDDLLAKTHKELLNATHLDHMVFPLGCRLNSEKAQFLEDEVKKAKKEGRKIEDIDILSDQDIIADLASVNCTVRRIVHGEQARHVYFWAQDSRAKQAGLDMGYKLKGHYAAEKKKITITPLEEMTDEELDAALKDEEFITKRYKRYAIPTPKAKTERPDTKQEKPKADSKKRRTRANRSKRKLSGVANGKAVRAKKPAPESKDGD